MYTRGADSSGWINDGSPAFRSREVKRVVFLFGQRNDSARDRTWVLPATPHAIVPAKLQVEGYLT